MFAPPQNPTADFFLGLEIRADFTDRPPRFWVGVAVSVYFLEKGLDFFSKVRSVSRTGAMLKLAELLRSSARPPPGSHLLEEYSVISLLLAYERRRVA